MSFAKLLVLTCTLATILFAVGAYVYLRFQKKLKLNLATIVSCFWSLVIGILVLECILYFPGDRAQTIQAIFAALAGAALGWILGMWISPVGRTESTKFATYWTAIGVGSGFTLKWAMDHAIAHTPWFKDHWLLTAVSAISCLASAAAVYNSRAYNSSLDIYPRPVPGLSTDPLKIKVGATADFYATLMGPSDPLCCWRVLPDASLGSIDADGHFKAGAIPAKGRITAFNIEDPTLSNFVEIEVTAL